MRALFASSSSASSFSWINCTHTQLIARIANKIVAWKLKKKKMKKTQQLNVHLLFKELCTVYTPTKWLCKRLCTGERFFFCALDSGQYNHNHHHHRKFGHKRDSNRLLCLNSCGYAFFVVSERTKNEHVAHWWHRALSLNYRVSDLLVQGSFCIILLIRFYAFKQTANINWCVASPILWWKWPRIYKTLASHRILADKDFNVTDDAMTFCQ